MNLTALMTATRTRLGVPSDDAFYTDTVVTDLVNAAIQWIASQDDWFWLENTETIACTNGVATYATASGSQSTIVLYDASGVPLERKPLDELVRMTTATSATPHFFSYIGSSVTLRPVPNGSFSLTHIYRGTETRLTTGTDVPSCPVQFHDAIADAAAMFAYKREGQLDQAKSWEDSANTWLATMKEEAYRYSDSTGGGEPPEAPDAKGGKGS